MIDLEERIRRAAELLDSEAVRVRELDPEMRSDSGRGDRRRPYMVQVAAGCMLLAGVVGMYLVATRDPASGPATSELPSGADESASTVVATAPVTSVATAVTSVPAGVAVGTSPPATTAPSVLAPPAATLPELTDASSVVPVTVMGTGPTEWYRLQRDLDVAWYSDGGEMSMLCFRTPAGQECQLDEFAPTANGGGPIGVRTVDDRWLVVTLDPESTVTLAFDNGETVTSQVERDDQIGWGVARIWSASGATPTGLAMVFAMNQPAPTVPVTSPPPTETAPVTIG